MTADGNLPTRRYSYRDADLPPELRSGQDWDKPSYLTLRGVVIHRAKLNNLAWAIFGRALGFSASELLAGADVNAFSRSQGDSSSSQNAIRLGGEVFDGLEMISREQVEGLQTADTPDGLNDVNLWPTLEPAVVYPRFPDLPTDYETLQTHWETLVTDVECAVGRVFGLECEVESSGEP